MSFKADDRGLASAVIGFIAILVVGAMLFIMLDPAMQRIFSEFSTRNPTTQQVQDTIALHRAIWGSILALPLAIGLVYIIGSAVLESRRP